MMSEQVKALADFMRAAKTLWTHVERDRQTYGKAGKPLRYAQGDAASDHHPEPKKPAQPKKPKLPPGAPGIMADLMPQGRSTPPTIDSRGHPLPSPFETEGDPNYDYDDFELASDFRADAGGTFEPPMPVRPTGKPGKPPAPDYGMDAMAEVGEPHVAAASTLTEKLGDGALAKLNATMHDPATPPRLAKAAAKVMEAMGKPAKTPTPISAPNVRGNYKGEYIPRDRPKTVPTMHDAGQMEEAYKAAIKDLQGELRTRTHPEDGDRVLEMIQDVRRAYQSGDPKKLAKALYSNTSADVFDRFAQALEQTPAVTTPAPAPQPPVAGPKRNNPDAAEEVTDTLMNVLANPPEFTPENRPQWFQGGINNLSKQGMDSSNLPSFYEAVRAKVQAHGLDYLRQNPEVVRELARNPDLRGLAAKLDAIDARTRVQGGDGMAASAEGDRAQAKTETPEFKQWFGESKAVDESGKPLTLYHGARRSDRIAEKNKFDPKRATSGPMAFFTSDQDIASKYATGKQDTSLEVPDSYAAWFKVKVPGSRKPVDVDRAWWSLPSETRQRIAAIAPRIANNDDGDPVLLDEDHTSGVGNYDYEIKEKRGNALAALMEGWLNGGVLYGREEQFLNVLKMAGLDGVEMHDPYAEHPGVFPVHLAIKNPLDTAAIPPDVFAALEQAAKRKRGKAGTGADPWDKRHISGSDWIARLNEDRKNGTTHAWTSIPDWATEALKAKGYDGIKDTGGKNGGREHAVWIPFHPGQIKSAIANKGAFDPANPRIDAMTDTQPAATPDAIAPVAPLTPAAQHYAGQLSANARQSLAGTTLPPEQQAHYAKNLDAVLTQMPEAALKTLHASNAAFAFHESPQAIATTLASGAFGDAVKSQAEKIIADGKIIGGAVVSQGGKLTVALDGGKDLHGTPEGQKALTRHGSEYYAHELTHVLDASGRDGRPHSDHPEWQDAWSSRLAGGALSDYATLSPKEGMAEFGRALFSGRYDRGELKTQYPEAFAYFVSQGWVPDVEAAKGFADVAEVFSEKVPLNRQGDHADVAMAVDGPKPVKTETPEFKRWFGESAVRDESGQPKRVFAGYGHDRDFEGGSRGVGLAYFSDDPAVAAKYAFAGGAGDDADVSEYQDKFLTQKDNNPKLKGRNPQTVPVYLSIANPITNETTLWDLFEGDAKKAAKAIYDWSPSIEQKVSEEQEYRQMSGEPPLTEEEWWDLVSNEATAGDAFAREDTLAMSGSPNVQAIASLLSWNPELAGRFDGMIYSDREAGGNTYVAFHPTQIKSAIANNGDYDPDNPRIDAMFEPRDVDLQWSHDHVTGTETIGGVPFTVNIRKRHMQSDDSKSWDVEFYRPSPHDDEHPIHDIFNDPNVSAVQVFSFVANAVRDFIEGKEPAQLSFSASSRDKSRVKLYDALAARVEKKYGYELTKQPVAGVGGGEKQIDYVLKRVPTFEMADGMLPMAEGGTSDRIAPRRPFDLPLNDMPTRKDMDKALFQDYLDGKSSRQHPSSYGDSPVPVGTWRVEHDFNGLYGHDVEQLQEIDPFKLVLSEDDYYGTKANPEGRGWDSDRYADWLRAGKRPPPIHAIETDSGQLRVTDGHRRVAAAKKAGVPIQVWVSPAVETGKIDSNGRPIKTGATYENMVEQAIKSGESVPPHAKKVYAEWLKRDAASKIAELTPLTKRYPGQYEDAIVKARKQLERADDMLIEPTLGEA